MISYALTRYLQTLATISSEKNSTIVFPIPIEMFSKFIKKDWKTSRVWIEDCRLTIPKSKEGLVILDLCHNNIVK